MSSKSGRHLADEASPSGHPGGHHGLHVEEILCMILVSLKDRAFGTLRSMAFTCKGFYEPACDVLGESPPRLECLLKLFPSDCWRIQDGRSVRVSYRIPARL